MRTPSQLSLQTRVVVVMQIATVTCACICAVATESSAQTPILEFRYEFDTEEAPLVDSTGENANLGLGSNGPEHRLGEDSLVGGDGFSIGLDAPGDGHPTGSYLVVPDAPHPESFSFSIWIRPQLTGVTEAIVARDNVWWPSPCAFYCLYIDQLQSLVWKTGGTEAIITEDGLIEADETYHLVVTHLDSDGEDSGSADRSRIYFNGEMIEELDDPTEIPSLDSIADGNGIYEALWLGTMSSFGGYWGEMDDFQFYSTELTPEHVAEMYANPGSLAGGNEPGDYNGDGALDALDIDLQAAEMKKDPADQDLAKFDHNGDGVINVGTAGPDDSNWGDRLIWIRNLRQTSVGDSNLDSIFDSGDLVVVFGAGKYETGEMATWVQGDWNGDMVFGSSDLVFAFSDGGYVSAASPAAVPEPSSFVLALLSFLGLAGVVRRRRED